jgi:predicted TIM-barrel fold metal-dependent hydrolase
MQSPAFPVYDADHHLYETEEALTKYLPDSMKREFYFVEKNGRKKLVIGGMVSDFIPNPTFDVVARPGAHEAYYRSENPEGKTLRELTGKPITPPAGWRTGATRIDELDEQGLHAALIFPTLASVVEERIGARGDVAAALFHSLNRWGAEEWGFARDNRLFFVPFINLTDVDAAVKELEYVLEQGARVVNIRPAPVPDIRGSRSFGFEEYDPFWSRVAEAGIFVTFHGSDSGYDRITKWWTGGGGEMKAFEFSPFKVVVDLIGRAITDSMAALICHGVFDRHPTLKVVSVENGAGWVAPLLHRLDRAYGKMPHSFKRHPRDVFCKHIFVAPFYEDDPDALVKEIPIEHILFGSDFPHAEGTSNPLDYLEEFAHFPAADIEKVFSSNLKGLLEGRAA